MSVYEAWTAVMADLEGLAKRDRNDHQGFNFRGIDAVMNAVGPVLRKHKVSVRPVAVNHWTEQVTSSTGKPMTSAIAQVTYEIADADGDTMQGAAPGEAFDSGDKATSKAMSVAFRTFLLQSLCLPTDEADPDAQSYERGDPTLADLDAKIEEAQKAGVSGDFDATREWAASAPVNVPVAISRLDKALAEKAA